MSDVVKRLFDKFVGYSGDYTEEAPQMVGSSKLYRWYDSHRYLYVKVPTVTHYTIRSGTAPFCPNVSHTTDSVITNYPPTNHGRNND